MHEYPSEGGASSTQVAFFVHGLEAHAFKSAMHSVATNEVNTIPCSRTGTSNEAIASVACVARAAKIITITIVVVWILSACGILRTKTRTAGDRS